MAGLTRLEVMRIVNRYIGVSSVAALALAAFLANIIPARRAVRIDPLVALRVE